MPQRKGGARLSVGPAVVIFTIGHLGASSGGECSYVVVLLLPVMKP
jgi:hypothetical protein